MDLPRISPVLVLLLLGFACLQSRAQTTQPAPAPGASAASTPPGITSPEATKRAQAAITAINSAADSVSKAADASTKATTYAKAIQDITGNTSKSSQSTTENLQSLQATVDAIQQNKIFTTLSSAATDLDSSKSGAESAVTAACDKSQLQQPSSGDQKDVTDAIAKCSAAQTNATTTLAAATAALTALQSAVQSISPYLARQFDDLTAKLKPFTDAKLISTDPAAAAPGTPDATVLLQTLPKGLPALRETMDGASSYQAAWNNMKATVQSKSAGATSTPAGTKDADTESTNLQNAINAIKLKLASWFPIITAKLTGDAGTLDGKLSGVASDPARNSPEAQDAVRQTTDTLSSVQSIVDAWPPMVGFLVDGQPTGFSLSTTKTNFETLQKTANILRASISRVHDALAGNFTDFETDQVSLYYFTDVPRLMYALNERYQTLGGVAEAKAQADTQRTALTKVELELADAQATVNRYQKQVLDLEEQQRQASEKLKGLNSTVSKLASRLKQAQDGKQKSDEALKDATDRQTTSTSSSSAGTPDPTLAASVDKAKSKQTDAAAKLSDAQSNYDAAKTDRDNAQAKADDTQNQKDSLPTKLEGARKALGEAQATVSRERRNMLLDAQAESDAFAFARDNTPFLYAPADASSPDPAKRVILYAFNDSKTIFMRGKPDDVSVVKRIIAQFDKPAPQARLTLWTFQLSADSGQKTNKKTVDHLNKSMEIVDQELGDTRALENTSLALLRDVINSEVARTTSTNGPDCKTVLVESTSADCEKLRRIHFYDPLVLKQLKFDLATQDPDRLVLLRKLLPDPADTTTLGEALMVLSLAPPDTKISVRDTFEQRINERLSHLRLAMPWPSADQNAAYLLPLTWHALGIWEKQQPDRHGLSSSQLEIVRALRASYESSLLSDILTKIQGWRLELGGTSAELRCGETPPKCPPDPGLYSRLVGLNQSVADLLSKGELSLSPTEKAKIDALEPNPGLPSHDQAMEKARLTRKAISALPAADQIAYDEMNRERLGLESRLSTIESQSAVVVRTLRSLGIEADSFLASTAFPNGDGTKSVNELNAPTVSAEALAHATIPPKSLDQIKKQVLNYPGLSTASPRVAAADQMLKELIIAVEDDLAREFIQPMITRLRTRLMQAHVSVGVIQRESLLASNRGLARIDPRASAQLAVGDQEDILTGIQQLAQIYASVQSGGALAALGALQQQPREPQPEIYALSTGNKFEVTPIFDPSGQALRFKFDFVATSNVQEPNGTTNTQLSRIERHTINTEVQLSNLETREISRFEANARLGLPTTYWGGLPILKDIPYVRPWVPLVGWFVRKGGSNASGQQSVIFGQTTIYPTIGALVDLVSDPGNVPIGSQNK